MVGELCVFLCGEVNFRDKMTGDEHGEANRDQKLKVSLRSPSTCWVFGMGIWKHSLLKASISLIGEDGNLKSEKKNQLNQSQWTLTYS